MKAAARDYGYEAHQAAEKHLAALELAQDREDDGEPGDWPPSAGPWCGCETCVVREVLFAAWPVLLAQARAEIAANPSGPVRPYGGENRAHDPGVTW